MSDRTVRLLPIYDCGGRGGRAGDNFGARFEIRSNVYIRIRWLIWLQRINYCSQWNFCKIWTDQIRNSSSPRGWRSFHSRGGCRGSRSARRGHWAAPPEFDWFSFWKWIKKHVRRTSCEAVLLELILVKPTMSAKRIETFSIAFMLNGRKMWRMSPWYLSREWGDHFEHPIVGLRSTLPAQQRHIIQEAL